MKKNIFMFIVFFLSGCTATIDKDHSQFINEQERSCVNGICIDKVCISSLLEKGKTEEEIFDIARYAYLYRYEYKLDNEDVSRQAENCFQYKRNPIDSDICLDILYRVSPYRDALIREKKEEELKRLEEEEKRHQKEKEEKEKYRQEAEKRLKQLKNKSGVDWCSPKNVISLISARQGNLPKDCMFELNYLAYTFFILQQTENGTLIHIPESNTIYFIEKNNVDSECVDSVAVKPGIFVNMGIHQYNNLFGSIKTVYKLKRIE